MTHHKPLLVVALRSILLPVALWACASAWADDYSEVSQLVRANQFAPALVQADKYLAAKPNDPQMRFLKGVIQRNLGKTAEAITTFTKLTQDHPELPEPYNNLAVLYAAQGQFDLARSALEMAIRTNPSYATAHENIGDVYARLASQAYNKALQLDSNNAAVPPKLALIREIFKPNLGNSRSAMGSETVALAPTAAKTSTPAVASAPANTSAAGNEPKPTAQPQVAASVPGHRASTPASAKPAAVQPPSNTAQAPASVADHAAVEAAVLAWAKAWSARDMAAYFKAYSPDFNTPRGQSRTVWEQDRTARIRGKSAISVQVSELKIKVQGDRATAQFRQNYKADALAVSSRKTLELKRHKGDWLIVRETTGQS
ncbi:MAG: hypothetical protein Fur007_01240 [Rhodoferax sp.]